MDHSQFYRGTAGEEAGYDAQERVKKLEKKVDLIIEALGLVIPANPTFAVKGTVADIIREALNDRKS